MLLNGLDVDGSVATAQARQVASKLIEALAQPYRLRVVNGGHAQEVVHHCTASAGVALLAGQDQSPLAVLDDADAAMYHAKEAGRNRVQVFEAGLAAAT